MIALINYHDGITINSSGRFVVKYLDMRATREALAHNKFTVATKKEWIRRVGANPDNYVGDIVLGIDCDAILCEVDFDEYMYIGKA